MEFDLHKVKRITATDLGSGDRIYWREITFEMQNGEKLQINV